MCGAAIVLSALLRTPAARSGARMPGVAQLSVSWMPGGGS